MQTQLACSEQLDAHPTEMVLETVRANQKLRYLAWIGVGTFVGTAMSASTMVVVLLKDVVGRSLVEISWIAVFSSVFVGSMASLLGGIILASVDRFVPPKAPHLWTATAAGGLFGWFVMSIVNEPVLGSLAGAAAGYCTAIWVTNPTRLPLENMMPVRGIWLRMAVTGLLIALTPFVGLGLFWRWPWSPR